MRSLTVSLRDPRLRMCPRRPGRLGRRMHAPLGGFPTLSLWAASQRHGATGTAAHPRLQRAATQASGLTCAACPPLLVSRAPCSHRPSVHSAPLRLLTAQLPRSSESRLPAASGPGCWSGNQPEPYLASRELTKHTVWACDASESAQTSCHGCVCISGPACLFPPMISANSLRKDVPI